MTAPAAHRSTLVNRARRHTSLHLVPLILLAASTPAFGFALSGGGVWDIPGGGGRIAWNPAAGDIGNMGAAGVTFSIGAAPAGAQAGAAAAATNAYARWNALGAFPLVRINLGAAGGGGGANLPLSWEALAGTPGKTTNAAVNALPRAIQLHNARTLRTDGWSLDLAGTRPAFIDEYDIYTTTVHEVGHGIGLGHPGNNTSVMTPQDAARGAGGSWRAIEDTAPFAGQPMTLGGAALPAGAHAYQNPRAALAADDILGAVSLYSPPIARILDAVNALGGGLFRYIYDLFNDADTRSAYRTRVLEIPVSSDVSVTDILSPVGWFGERLTAAVRWTYTSPDALDPGQMVHFEYTADAPPVRRIPETHWEVIGLDLGGGTPDLSGGDDPHVAPPFNVADFEILDGRFNYELEGERWRTVLFAPVVSPQGVPEPPGILLVIAGLWALGGARKLRKAEAGAGVRRVVRRAAQ